jgi:hypothetical protein
MDPTSRPRNFTVTRESEDVETGSPEAPIYGLDSPVRYSERPQRVRVDRFSRIWRVSVLPPREESKGKSSYRLHLLVDSHTDQSSQSRRTGTLEGLEIDVEEKDLAPLARLSGKEILVHYLLWDKDVNADILQRENADLRQEIEVVKRKLRETQDQLQISIESQLRDQRR